MVASPSLDRDPPARQNPAIQNPAARRETLGALDLSLPPDLGQMLRGTAQTLGESPRLLALEILRTVLGGDLVGAVLDRG